METEDQDLAGNYDIHVPFIAKNGKRYKLIPIEQETFTDYYDKKPSEKFLGTLPVEQKLNVPTEEEIETYFKTWQNPRIKCGDEQYEKWLNKYLDELIDSAINGAKWMKDEIITRNDR